GKSRGSSKDDKEIGVDSQVQFDVALTNGGPNPGFMDKITTVLPANLTITTISATSALSNSCDLAAGSGCASITRFPGTLIANVQHPEHYYVTGYFAAKDL